MKTPLPYSIVPIAPSNSTIRDGSRSSPSSLDFASDIRGLPPSRPLALSTSFGPDRIVLRLRMMRHEGRRALFGNQLKRLTQGHPELLLRGQQTEHDLVIVEIRARGIPPRVALAAARRNSQLGLLVAMHPLRHRFGRLDGEAVREVRLGVFVGALKLREPLIRLRSDRHDLQRGDVYFARLDTSIVVRETQA